MAADLYFREVDLLRERAVAGPRAATSCAPASATRDHEPYRALLRDVRERLLATRKWAEAHASRIGAAAPAAWSRPAPARTSISRSRRWPSRCGSAIARCARPATPSIADGRLADILRRLACVRPDAGAARHPPGLGRHTAALDAITRALGLGSYAEWSEEERQQFLMRELGGPAPAGAAAASRPSPEVQDVLRHVPDAGAAALGIARRLRHHDGVGAVGRARGRAAAARVRRRRGRCASCRCSRPPTTCAQAGSMLAPAAVGAVVPRAHRRPPGSDDRLLRLGQGRRPARRRLGALQGAGGDRRGLPRHRRAASRCSTAAAAASAAAAGRPTSPSSRSRPARSTARSASPSRAR